MSNFKCIGCGTVSDSSQPLSCPVCGHIMFEEPYDRKAVLTAEIENFISKLQITELMENDILVKQESKEVDGFPSYEQILKYVTGPRKTEGFLKNLLTTTEQLKAHFTTHLPDKFAVSFENLEERIKHHDKILHSALCIIAPDTHIELAPIDWQAISKFCSDAQSRRLSAQVKELLELIEKLTKKIAKFIKANNIYSDTHKYRPEKRSGAYDADTDLSEEFESAITTTEDILAKKYIIDITDDGSDELEEMLDCFWQDVDLIMYLPLSANNFAALSQLEDADKNELVDKISVLLAGHYEGINKSISIQSLLEDKTEDELFDVYKQLISIDEFEIFTPVSVATPAKPLPVMEIGENEKKLNQLIGLANIKKTITKIKAYALANKGSKDLNIHMCFLGNPGTGKTEVARYIAGILYENKILPKNTVVEVDRSRLVSAYIGDTAKKTSDAIEEAMGGVLFIDEAYALNLYPDSSSDYGKEAVDTLIKAMEDSRGKFCVILAGYKNEMLQMLSMNPGFQSRIQFTLDFPNYSRDELKRITELMLKKRNYTIGEPALNRILDITDIKRKEANFANAREIRHILDQVIMCQNVRCIGTGNRELGMADVNEYIHDAKLYVPTDSTVTHKILTGEEELNRLIGLSSIKTTIKKIRAYAKHNKNTHGFNIHMCFYGNPGTGKTEVARILSRLLYDAEVLSEAKYVEVDAHDLIGKYIGHTAPKTKAKINEAMGGVLFIDEAYELYNNSGGLHGNSFGKEAIAALLKEMEDHRGQFCVILAGYKKEMQYMLSANPGFKSRIQFTLDFPDYTREDLREIAKSFLSKKRAAIDELGLEKILDIADFYRNEPNFANARTIRNILDQVIMNQNLRAEDNPNDNTIIMDDIEAYIAEEQINLSKPQ